MELSFVGATGPK